VIVRGLLFKKGVLVQVEKTMRYGNVLFTCAFCCFALSGIAQDTSANYVKLFSGEIVRSQEIRYHNELLKKSYFTVGGVRYEQGDIAYYKAGSEVKANTRELTIFKSSSFAPRIESGKANLFIGMNHYNYEDLDGWLFGPKKRLYFNVNGGTLMTANFNNLRNNLAENMDAMQYASQYHDSNVLEHALYTISGIAVAYGLIAMVGTSFGGESKFIAPALGISVIAAVVALHLDRQVQPKKIQLAVISYNKKHRKGK
jgi:hypothetical protein